MDEIIAALEVVLDDRRRKQGTQAFINDVAQLLLLTRAEQKAILLPRVQEVLAEAETPTEAQTEAQTLIDRLNAAVTALS